MARTNRPSKAKASRITTHEGGTAKRINARQQLRRSVLACMLWEKSFYEDGIDIAQRIVDGVQAVTPEFAANLAVEARVRMKLRHVPLLIARAMAALDTHKHLVGQLLPQIMLRADEPMEFLSLYRLDGKKTPLSGQVKKGLARAVCRFTEYDWGKYVQHNKAGIKPRDVIMLCHPKPKDEAQSALFKKLVSKDDADKLAVPDTWEVALSTGKDKRETWERLIAEEKLGGLALLRNLRNMREANVPNAIVAGAIKSMRTDRILPFRFISATKYAPALEAELEETMFRCLDGQPKILGKTVLLVDVSGSMNGSISDKSELKRMEAASALAILCREKCENVSIYTFSDECVQVPARRGFALSDAIVNSQEHRQTYLTKALQSITEGYDRIIVFTDEQSQDGIVNPKAEAKGWLLNVAAYRNGVGYGKWQHIDGFSEACIDYILESEGLSESKAVESVNEERAKDEKQA